MNNRAHEVLIFQEGRNVSRDGAGELHFGSGLAEKEIVTITILEQKISLTVTHQISSATLKHLFLAAGIVFAALKRSPAEYTFI
jgi:hypothetical protein